MKSYTTKYKKLSTLRGLVIFVGLLSMEGVSADASPSDLDIDNDGLIEIRNFTDLNEIRNNLDGSTLYSSNYGCPESGCYGFELTKDLNFDTNGDSYVDANDEYWNEGLGWEPIGTSENPFTATFEGNGYSINNLYINLNGGVLTVLNGYTGLLGNVQSAEIRNFTIVDTLVSFIGTISAGGDSTSPSEGCSGDMAESSTISNSELGSICELSSIVLTLDLSDTEIALPYINFESPVEGNEVFVIDLSEFPSVDEECGANDFSGDNDSFCVTGSTISFQEGADGDSFVAISSIPVIPSATFNFYPIVTAKLSQAGQFRAVIYEDQGPAEIQAWVTDEYELDPFTYSWNSPKLVQLNDSGESVFTFDPAGLSGAFEVTVTVTDSGGLSDTAKLILRVDGSAPVLSDNEDADQDGLSDSLEGFLDLDGDRIPDYLDRVAVRSQLPVNRTGAVMQSSEGTSLRLGDSAYIAGQQVGQVTLEDIDNLFEDNLAGQNSYKFLHGIFDFVVYDTDFGESANIVVPLNAALLEGARYLKYRQSVGWVDFIEDEFNHVSSALGQLGDCPEPGSDEYQPGLHEGHFCIQLSLQDGGPNDDDGEVNGIIVDPGAVATLNVNEPIVSINSYLLERSQFLLEQEAPVLAFSLQSDSADAILKSFTIKADGELNEVSDLQQVRLYLDRDSDGIAAESELIGNGFYSIDNGSLTLDLFNKFQLPVGETRFLVTYEF
ncbi:choice-of-anchor U domain-containing protein [Microbulbifer sp. TRSA001]|uniref:choice-of-anchor U domain-containing protein n=1 Tax=Microbulbifer sp. TRSA001 TaxID=3243381 RepID=UPI0040399E2C